jgi:SAM-dependent methyltransferase
MAQFSLDKEREYYQSNPNKLVITEELIVEDMMYLTTGNKEWSNLFANKVILEVGAGECSYLHCFLKKSQPKKFILQDIFAERMKYAKAEYNKAEFIGSDVLKLPIKEDAIDLCMAFGLLHHIPNIEEALGEIARVLKPRGNFIFRDPWVGNPAIWLKYRFGHKSENEFPLSFKRIQKALQLSGLTLTFVNRFWIRFPWLPVGPWSVNIGGVACKI